MKKINLGFGLAIWIIAIIGWQTIFQKNEVSIESPSRDAGAINRGKILAEACIACHNLGGNESKIGPYLTDIIGRKAGSVEGYQYSTAMKNSNIYWTRENLSKFIQNPSKIVPNTSMGFAGVSASDADDIITFMESRN